METQRALSELREFAAEWIRAQNGERAIADLRTDIEAQRDEQQMALDRKTQMLAKVQHCTCRVHRRTGEIAGDCPHCFMSAEVGSRHLQVETLTEVLGLEDAELPTAMVLCSDWDSEAWELVSTVRRLQP